MSATVSLNPNENTLMSGLPIVWEYFFGGQTTSGRATRFYSAYVGRIRVEKRWHSPNNLSYSIGNYDKAKKKFKTEDELLKAVAALSPPPAKQQEP